MNTSNLNFLSEIRLLPWSKFVKDLSQRFTVTPIFRRHNEHKTRPCSLVLMRRPVPASYIVLRPSFPQRRSSSFCSVSISDDTSKCFISRGPSRVNGSPAEPDRKGNTTRSYCFDSRYVYMCGYKVTESVRFRISISIFVSIERRGK